MKVPHTAKFFSSSAKFEAIYNAITPGRYDFGKTVLCQNVDAFRLEPGSIYLIESISVGVNVPEEDYFGSIDLFPAVAFKYRIRGDGVYRDPMALTRYFDGFPCTAWVYSDKSDEFLTMSMNGSCIQLPTMIGIASMKINVSLSCKQIDDQRFNAWFRGKLYC